MSTLLHRDPKTIFPDLVDWFEEPSYRHGILTISVGLKTEHKASAKKVEIATGK